MHNNGPYWMMRRLQTHHGRLNLAQAGVKGISSHLAALLLHSCVCPAHLSGQEEQGTSKEADKVGLHSPGFGRNLCGLALGVGNAATPTRVNNLPSDCTTHDMAATRLIPNETCPQGVMNSCPNSIGNRVWQNPCHPKLPAVGEGEAKAD